MRPETRPRYDLVTLKLQRTPLQLLNPKSLAHPPSTPQSFYLSRNHAQEHAATHKSTLSIAGFHLSPFGSLDQFLSSHRLRYVISLLGFSVKWIGFIVFISLFFTHLLPVQCLGCYHKVWQIQFARKVFNNILYKR